MAARERHYYVYMMSNRSKTIYTGMTNSLERRVFQHKSGVNEGFTHAYKLDRLVYWEHFGDVVRAIAREKQIKGWLRIKKIQLIVSRNPAWADLSRELYPWMEQMVLDELKKKNKSNA
jgi:putative endonuclease